jgi:deazaflavin-dependent oxidoreductase (nitroreductase family)
MHLLRTPGETVAGLRRWLYRDGRPNPVGRLMNRADAAIYGSGWVLPNRLAVLAVPGRRTGRTVTMPVAIADHEGERYLVSMLGEGANWVRNVRAAGGHAELRHRRHERVLLEEVEPGARAPILRRYMAVAPGARAHFPVDRHAPLGEFERIAADFPVFHIVPE